MTSRRSPVDALFALRPEWRYSRRFSPIGFEVTAPIGERLHRQGGPSHRRGAKCPRCRKPLTLIWDIAVTDDHLPEAVADCYGPVERLPLLFCGGCGACAYRVTEPGVVTCFAVEPDGDSPFEELPAELPESPVALTRLTTEIDALLTLSDIVGLDAFDELARETLTRFAAGRLPVFEEGPLLTDSGLPFDQFGGHPLLGQGERDIVCPNAECPASRLKHPYGHYDRPLLMKRLAVVTGSSSPVIREFYSQVAYHACCVCFTVHAEYRCS